MSARLVSLCVPVLSAELKICDDARPSCRIDGGRGRDTQGCLWRFSNACSSEVFDDLRVELSEDPFRETRWITRGSPPGNALERAAFEIAELLGLAGRGQYESVEYWTKHLALVDGFGGDDNFHLDTVQEWEDCASFPWVSSILYLDNNGPPTVVLSKALSDCAFVDPRGGPVNDTTFLSWPMHNHLLAFSGDMVHGVHWPKGPQHATLTGNRTIVVFNFWRHAPPEQAASAEQTLASHSVISSVKKDLLPQLIPAIEQNADSHTHVVTLDEHFGFRISFSLTYRLPSDIDDRLSAASPSKPHRLAQQQWAVFFAVPGSLQTVQVHEPLEFHGDFAAAVCGLQEHRSPAQEDAVLASVDGTAQGMHAADEL